VPFGASPDPLRLIAHLQFHAQQLEHGFQRAMKLHHVALPEVVAVAGGGVPTEHYREISLREHGVQETSTELLQGFFGRPAPRSTRFLRRVYPGSDVQRANLEQGKELRRVGGIASHVLGRPCGLDRGGTCPL